MVFWTEGQCSRMCLAPMQFISVAAPRLPTKQQTEQFLASNWVLLELLSHGTKLMCRLQFFSQNFIFYAINVFMLQYRLSTSKWWLRLFIKAANTTLLIQGSALGFLLKTKHTFSFSGVKADFDKDSTTKNSMFS